MNSCPSKAGNDGEGFKTVLSGRVQIMIGMP